MSEVGRSHIGNSSWWGAHLLGRGSADGVWAISRATVTRAELRWKVGELQCAFHEQGIGRGSTAVLRMAPSFTLLQALFALWSCGAQVILVDFRLKPAEHEPLVELLEPQYVVSSGDGGPIVGFRDEADFVVERRPSGRCNHTDVCLVQFSSGSTGKPKVIGRSPDALLAELDRFAALDGMPGKGDRLILLNSVIHTMGLVSGVLHALNAETTVVLPPSMQPSDVLRVAAETKACAIFGVPLHFDLLCRAKNTPDISSLRLAVSAGEQLSLETYERFRYLYHLPISPVYGTTEVGIIASDLAGTHPPPSVGVPAPGIDVKVVDQELYVRMDRSPYLYIDRSGRFVDGWLRTFDRFEQDPYTGVLSILGRADSVVVIGGVKIDLTEVEAVLVRHPGVAEAVVVFGEVIEAFVAADSRVEVNELTTWCRDRLSSVKIPKRFFVGLDLPRNPNGKLIRDRDSMHIAYAESVPH